MSTTGVLCSSDDDQTDVLLNIGRDLTEHNVDSIKFLIAEDLVPLGTLEEIHNARDIIYHLQNERDLKALLRELLYTIGRHDIMKRYYNKDKRAIKVDLANAIQCISPYRKLLHTICEELDSNAVADLKMLSSAIIPENDLQSINSGYELFLALEKQGQIDEHNVEFLMKILLKARNIRLAKMVEDFQQDIYSPLTGHIDAEPPGRMMPRPFTDGQTQMTCCHMKEELSYEGDDITEVCTQVTKEQLKQALDQMGKELLNLRSNILASMLDEYSMTHSPRGHCVIINNMNFVTKQSYRNEGEVDCEALKTRFRELNFIIRVKSNLNKEEVEALVHEYRQMDHSSYDCFVICVLGHGKQDHFLCVDDKAFSIKRLMQNFSTSNCPSLAGKPKLFFIQACQGDFGMLPANVDDDLEIDGDGTIPDMTDMVLAQSLFQGNAAFRSKTEGSWFISTLCDVFYECHSRLHLVDMLIEVNRRVAEAKALKGETFYKQCPAPMITLKKAVWFRPHTVVCQPID